MAVERRATNGRREKRPQQGVQSAPALQGHQHVEPTSPARGAGTGRLAGDALDGCLNLASCRGPGEERLGHTNRVTDCFHAPRAADALL